MAQDRLVGVDKQSPLFQPELVTVTDELLVAILNVTSLGPGDSAKQDVSFTTLLGQPVLFRGVEVLQVEVVGALLPTDSLTLSLYRSRRVRDTQDLVARYSGRSHVATAWKAVFVGQQLGYADQDGNSQLHLTLSASSTNSLTGDCSVAILARSVA